MYIMLVCEWCYKSFKQLNSMLKCTCVFFNCSVDNSEHADLENFEVSTEPILNHAGTYSYSKYWENVANI